MALLKRHEVMIYLYIIPASDFTSVNTQLFFLVHRTLAWVHKINIIFAETFPKEILLLTSRNNNSLYHPTHAQITTPHPSQIRRVSYADNISLPCTPQNNSHRHSSSPVLLYFDTLQAWFTSNRFKLTKLTRIESPSSSIGQLNISPHQTLP